MPGAAWRRAGAATVARRGRHCLRAWVGGLEAKLASGEVSVAVFGSLSELCRALGGGDVQAALNVHVQITTSDWADNGQWLMGLKRLIEMVAKLQVRL